MYCGDDVSAAIIDLGHYETRAGYSGDDSPKSVIPSCIGAFKSDDSMDGQRHFISGYSELNFKRDNMKIEQLFQEDGISK